MQADIYGWPPEKLSEYLNSLDNKTRTNFFEELRLKLYPEKEREIALPNEILENNLSGLRVNVDHEVEDVLGNFKGYELIRTQHSLGEETVLSYFAKIGDRDNSEMSWVMHSTQRVENFHRFTYPSNRRQGLGSALLFLSEEAFRKLGFREAVAVTQIPETASWFFRKGYFPETVTPSILKVLLSKETKRDYGDENELYLKKELII